MDWTALEEHAVSVLQAASRVLLICGAGAVLARLNILDQPTRKCFSHLCKTLFLPALLVAHVTASVSVEELQHWWSLPVFCTLYTGAGLALGWVVAKVLRVPKAHVPLVMVASALPNCSSIPLAVMDSLIDSSDKLAGSDPLEAKARSVSLILFYTLFMTIFRWTLGYQMLAPPAEFGTLLEESGGAELGDVELVNARPLQAQQERAQGAEAEAAPVAIPRASLGAKAVFKKVMNPPIVACLVSICVGLITPFKNLFFGDDAPFEPSVTGALISVGQAYVPLVILVLGANLSKGPGEAVPPKTLIGITLVRLVAIPLLGIYLLGVFDAALPSDPLLRLVLLLESAFPPAINLSVMVTLHGYLEKEMASILFYEYLIAVVTVPLWLLLFMPVAGVE